MNTDADLRPALLGGPRVRPQGPSIWPLPDPDILQALDAAFQDGSWGKYHGIYVERLAERLAEYHATEFVLPCASGTFAVELALRALGVGPGNEVILAAYDYAGNFLTVHAVGAMPVLAEIAPGNWNLDPVQVEAAIGPASRAILVSHLHGGVVPMREIMAVAVAHSLPVIEDAAQAPGALIQGRKAGTWGDVGILSFGGSKLLSAGRGGALLTRRADLHQRARLYLNRGNQICPLSELQAAVLLPQLQKLDQRNRQRAQSVRLLCQNLEEIPGIRPLVNGTEQTEPGYYKVGFQYDSEQFGLERERWVAAMQAEGIAFDEGFRALHVGRSPGRYRPGGSLNEAERAHAGTLVLHHPVLLGSPTDIEEIGRAAHKIHANAQMLSRDF